jgi:hypothetical protein
MGWGHANSEAIRATTSQLTRPTPQIVIYMFSQFTVQTLKKNNIVKAIISKSAKLHSLLR